MMSAGFEFFIGFCLSYLVAKDILDSIRRVK